MTSQLAYLQSLSDAKLVKHFQHGCRRAFDVLMMRHTPHVKIYLHALLHNADKESEAFQELWIEVMDELAKRLYHEHGNFIKWLNTMTFWAARHARPGKSPFVQEADSPIPDEGYSMEEPHFKHEEYIPFIKANLSTMNARTREIVRLRIEEELKFSEIEEEMHLKKDEACTYYSRAMTKLRKLFTAAARKR